MLRWAWVVLTLAETLGVAGCGASGERKPETPVTQPSRDEDPLSITAPVTRYSLQNGLVVVLNEDHRLPFVVVDVTYRVGAADDPVGRAGMAHLLEHLLFHGSRHVPELKHFEYLENAGASKVLGMTTPHVTDVWEVVPRSELALALWLESDRMAFALETVTEPMVTRERRVLELEWAQRFATVPNGLVEQLTAEQIFPAGHPYRSLFEPSGLRDVALQTVRDFQQTYYGPNNAVLALSGDFDGDRARRQVAEYFEGIPPRPAPTHAKPAPIVLGESRTVRIEARVDDASVHLSWPTPPFGAAGDAELDVVANHLNRHELEAIVREQKLAFSVYANQRSRRLNSVFTIDATLRHNVEPAEVIAAIDAALRHLRTRPLDINEVKEGARRWEYHLYLGQDDIVARVLDIAEHALIDRDAQYLQTQMHRYQQLTANSTAQAVSAYLLPDRRVITIVEPNRKAPVAGRLVAGP